MKKWIKKAGLIPLLTAFAFSANATVTVTNVTASQQSGTKLVNIEYDLLSDTTNTLAISVKFQSGSNTSICLSTSGDIGLAISPGTGKKIVWNAGADWYPDFDSLTLIVTAASIGGTEKTEGSALKRWSLSSGGNGNVYELFLQPATWSNAYEESLGQFYFGAQGHLATLTSAEENMFVFAAFSNLWLNLTNGGPLLGGYQINKTDEPRGNWAWVTGENWLYTSWNTGEPNNTAGVEDVIHFSRQGAVWNDFPAGNVRCGYIVEYEADDIYSDFESFSETNSCQVDTRDYLLMIHSEYGSPLPNSGTNNYAWHSSVTCSVTSVINNSGTNYTCTGWAGTGSVPTTGDDNTTGVIVLTNVDSSITWNWQVSGDIDGDGIPDVWEFENSGNAKQVNANADDDHDGYTAYQEYRLGTSPTNAQSRFNFACIPPGTGKIYADLNFSSATGRTYTLQFRDSLTSGSWLPYTQLDGTGSNLSVKDYTSGTKRFYRVTVDMKE